MPWVLRLKATVFGLLLMFRTIKTDSPVLGFLRR